MPLSQTVWPRVSITRQSANTASFSENAFSLNRFRAQFNRPDVIDAVLKSADPYQLEALGQGLGALAGKLNDAQTAVVARANESEVQLRALEREARTQREQGVLR